MLNFNDVLLYKEILRDDSEFKIWKELDNGCSIGTLGYSEENAKILYDLLQSFAEQYGEVIDMDSAREELMLYQKRGKLFIYFDENGKPVSMNGVIYNEDNISVSFKSTSKRKLNSLYFYGLSTLHEYRGRGACRNLVNFAIKYAYYNNFDYVYARTDLVNSNSEWIMHNAGLEVCENEDGIITEWVPVTDSVGDYRLHMWLPLKDDLYLEAKRGALIADSNTREIKTKKFKALQLRYGGLYEKICC